MNAEPSQASLEKWRQREQLLEAFERAWLCGESPNLADFLPAEFADQASFLADLVRVEVEFRRPGRLKPVFGQKTG